MPDGGFDLEEPLCAVCLERSYIISCPVSFLLRYPFDLLRKVGPSGLIEPGNLGTINEFLADQARLSILEIAKRRIKFSGKSLELWIA